MSKVKDLTGKKFGRLTVIERAGSNKDGRATWLCQCVCGNTSVKIGKLLLNGHCQSCGCGEYENRVNNCTSHKMSNTRLYNIWQGAKQRCYYHKHKSYNEYGGRGIKICDEWLTDFTVFYDWAITNGYSDNLTLDRIDVNGNYEPNNCRWVTISDQSRNKRDNVLITLNGETRILKDWCEFLNIPISSYYYRIHKGMSCEEALLGGGSIVRIV